MKRFLQSGQLGPISLGMSRQQVEAALGPPDVVGGTSRRQREPSIWKYGPLELHFEPSHGALGRIFSDRLEALQRDQRLAFDPWILGGVLERGRAEEELRSAGIAHLVRPYEYEPHSDEIVTEARIHLLFKGDSGDLARTRRLVAFWLEREPSP